MTLKDALTHDTRTEEDCKCYRNINPRFGAENRKILMSRMKNNKVEVRLVTPEIGVNTYGGGRDGIKCANRLK